MWLWPLSTNRASAGGCTSSVCACVRSPARALGRGRRGLRGSLLRMAGEMAIGSAVVAAALSACGNPLLLLVYGQSIASYTYLLPLVLVGTVALAFLWFFADILVICRDLKGMLLAAVVAVATTFVTVNPLEASFGMNGINFTVVASALAGMLVALVRLRICVMKNERSSGVTDEEEN